MNLIFDSKSVPRPIESNPENSNYCDDRNRYGKNDGLLD